MIPSNTQIEKAVAVFVNLLSRTEDISPSAIRKFDKALSKVLEEAGDIMMIGAVNGPDSLLTKALQKANLPRSAISDVIMVSYERGDKVLYWLDGDWHEQIKGLAG